MWPNIWLRYARTFGVIGLLALAVVSSTALAAFATADRLTLARLARMETRRPEEVVSISFTGAADEDPLRGLP